MWLLQLGALLLERLARGGVTMKVGLIRQRVEFAAAQADVVSVSCFCARGMAA
ncbi:MAG TPA: hypothetical protein VKI44_13810 [Acetobacteraceae bacterium]|nr:hypothetical protein [Acetobacteraceae bacterium]